MSFSNPIDFPFPANDGDTYEFESRVYNYQKASGLPGYWELTNPGSLGAAGGAEITAARVDGGGNNNRYIGPQGLAESDYLNEVSYSSADSNAEVTGPFTRAKDAPINFTRNAQALYNGQDDDPLNGFQITASEGGIDILMQKATTAHTGATRLTDEFDSTVGGLSGSDLAVAQATRRGRESSYNNNYQQSGSTPGYFRIKSSSQATDGFQISYGYQVMSTASHVGTVTIPSSLSYSSSKGGLGTVLLQPFNGEGYCLMTVANVYSTGFSYRSGGGANGFYWFVCGVGVAMSKASSSKRIVTPDGPIN